MGSLKIGEVARASGVGIETIRFYERDGLLAKPDRKPSGYRQYDPSVVARLQFIRDTKELGFALSEIRELLRLRFDAETRCAHIRDLATRKIKDIETRILNLQNMRRSLQKILKGCEQKNTVDDCPLLKGLGNTSSVGPNRRSVKRKA